MIMSVARRASRAAGAPSLAPAVHTCAMNVVPVQQVSEIRLSTGRRWLVEFQHAEWGYEVLCRLFVPTEENDKNAHRALAR